MIRVYRDDEFVTLRYDTHGKIVHHTLHQPVSGPVFRAVLTRGAELFEQQRACKWLSDDRNNGALHPDDAKWAMETWSERVMAAGWKYWAIVLPDAALGRINMKRFINAYSDRGVEVRIYDDADEALTWLRRAELATAWTG